MLCAPMKSLFRREVFRSEGRSSHAVRVSAKSVFPPVEGGGRAAARRMDRLARRGLKLLSTWKRVDPRLEWARTEDGWTMVLESSRLLASKSSTWG